MVTLKGASAYYYCLSTDDKPEDAPVNAIAKELDTGKEFYFTGETWAEVGGAS